MGGDVTEVRGRRLHLVSFLLGMLVVCFLCFVAGLAGCGIMVSRAEDATPTLVPTATAVPTCTPLALDRLETAEAVGADRVATAVGVAVSDAYSVTHAVPLGVYAANRSLFEVRVLLVGILAVGIVGVVLAWTRR